jgi:hypothetical protein
MRMPRYCVAASEVFAVVSALAVCCGSDWTGTLAATVPFASLALADRIMSHALADETARPRAAAVRRIFVMGTSSVRCRDGTLTNADGNAKSRFA